MTLLEWLLFTLLVGVFTIFYALKRAIFGKQSRRPDNVRNADNDITEQQQKKRTLRLRQQFSLDALPPPSEIDAIVIGSGVGGLATGAILAKTGRRVVVLERAKQAGGCSGTLILDDHNNNNDDEQQLDGYEWPIGIHYVGRMGPRYIDRYIVDHVLLTSTTRALLDWQPLEDDVDNLVLVRSSPTADEDGKRSDAAPNKVIIPMWADRRRLLSELIDRYPKHETGLRRFYALMNRAWRGCFLFFALKCFPINFSLFHHRLLRIDKLFFPNYSTDFHDETLKAAVDQLFGGDEEEVKLVLDYNFGDYGVQPSRASPGVLSLIYAYYTDRAYYPIGGPGQIAYALVETIENAGGRVLVNANVTEILLENGDENNKNKAIGVRIIDDGSSSPDHHQDEVIVDIKAPIVVSDAGVSNTFRKLLPKAIAERTKIGQLLDSGRIHSSLATFQVCVGLKGSQAELQLPAKNFWIYFDTDIDRALERWNSFASLEDALESDCPLPFLFASFPSAKDPSYQHRFITSQSSAGAGGRSSVCSLITGSPIKWFRNKGDQDDDVKMRLANRCWQHFVRELFPQLADRLDYIGAVSPVAFSRQLNAPDGETYGLDHDTERFSPEVASALRPRVPEIENLYLTGQDVGTCGFGGAIAAALITCLAILPPHESAKLTATTLVGYLADRLLLVTTSQALMPDDEDDEKRNKEKNQ